ncbi:MAG: phosphotransferase, partial [Myxococcales bacterium]|nr:phosphotransferase [Myxococcales bacterium]
RMDRILRRIRKQEIGAPLAPALDWLATHRPPPPKRRTLVHGDLGPTNFLVRDGEVRCVLDWSKALLAEPEAEVGFLRASLRTAAIAGLGRWNTLLSWPLGRIGARVERRLAAERELDPERVRWYETLRSVALLASVAKRTRPGRGRPHVLDERRSFSAICRQLSQLTGTPEPRLPARGSVID